MCSCGLFTVSGAGLFSHFSSNLHILLPELCDQPGKVTWPFVSFPWLEWTQSISIFYLLFFWCSAKCTQRMQNSDKPTFCNFSISIDNFTSTVGMQSLEKQNSSDEELGKRTHEKAETKLKFSKSFTKTTEINVPSVWSPSWISHEDSWGRQLHLHFLLCQGQWGSPCLCTPLCCFKAFIYHLLYFFCLLKIWSAAFDLQPPLLPAVQTGQEKKHLPNIKVSIKCWLMLVFEIIFVPVSIHVLRRRKTLLFTIKYLFINNLCLTFLK